MGQHPQGTAFSNSRTEASRAKHKFAVKRNSWPKTRGVAMNPVDHPHGGVSSPRGYGEQVAEADTRCRVTTNISARRRPSPDTPPRARRPVSLPREGRVCCVVLRRRRTEGQDFAGVSLGWCYCGLLASIDGTAASRSPVAQKQAPGHSAHAIFFRLLLRAAVTGRHVRLLRAELRGLQSAHAAFIAARGRQCNAGEMDSTLFGCEPSGSSEAFSRSWTWPGSPYPYPPSPPRPAGREPHVRTVK